ncbi:biopolymer transporter ExbD, partial [Burkholderia sp. HAN2018]|nr:biopolymer transporter ExbD [Burkholderia sp. HAN2018]
IGFVTDVPPQAGGSAAAPAVPANR